MNPYGKVPVLTDDSTVLYESLIINEYLEEKYPTPSLLPKDPAKKAKARILTDYGMAHFDSPYQKLRMELMKDAKEQSQPVIDGAKTDLKKLLQRFEEELGDQQYLLGDFSLVDANLIPRFTRLEGFRHPARSIAAAPREIPGTHESASIGQSPVVGLRLSRVLDSAMHAPKSGLFATVFSALLSPVIDLLDKPSKPRYRGEISLTGLQRAVNVTFDRYAVPHVRAADEEDMFFAQGYLHAQERLWQMELSRRFLSGRMAELFGDFTLPWRELSSQFRGHKTSELDFFIRLLGIRQSAIESLSLLTDDDSRRLNAYSQGINRYIEQCGKKLPWEFRLLRFAPEPWSADGQPDHRQGAGVFTLHRALHKAQFDSARGKAAA